MIDELYSFINSKSNVHLDIKKLSVSLCSTVTAAEEEWRELKTRCEAAEALAKSFASGAAMATPTRGPNPLGTKRKKSPAGEIPKKDSYAKKVRTNSASVDAADEIPAGPSGINVCKEVRTDTAPVSAADEVPAGPSGLNDGEWRTVTRKPPPKKTRPAQAKPKRARKRGDAIVVKMTGKLSYADLLRKVRADPALKEMGSNVVRTRRTQAGEMLFELKKDPSVHSSNYKGLIEKSLGEEGQVKALSQRALIEVKNLDEITSTDDLQYAMREQLGMEVASSDIRLRKAYGKMQIVTVNVPEAAASEMLKAAKLRVGWSVCTLTAKRQLERCFRCLGFGHRAGNCKAPDRSKLCRRCGDEGHFANGCTKPPRCLLCTTEAGNRHATGGPACPAYKRVIKK